MAITVVAFGQGLLAGMKAGQDMDGCTYKLQLHTSTFAPDVDVMDFQNDLTNEVATASGYTAGGVTLATNSLTYDTASDQIRWDWTVDPTWTFSAGVSWQYGVVLNSTPGTSATNNLMFLLNWGSTQTVSGVYTITIDPTGLYAIDVT